MIFLMIVINIGISVFNAWSVGRSWLEAKMEGGWARFMAWMIAVMAAVGFTWSYLAGVALVCEVFELLPPEYIKGMFSLGYLAIIIPAIGSGLAITLQSWAVFWKNRTVANGAVAGYNTFAQIYNMYEFASALPDLLSSVGDMFTSSEDDDDDVSSRLIVIAVALAIGSIALGILTARAIILWSAKNVADEYRALNET